MKERLLRLLTVKSIVAILLTLVFAYLSVCGLVAADQFLTVFTIIIAFYFGTQAEEANQNREGWRRLVSRDFGPRR